MKKSELRQLIREEIKKSLTETFQSSIIRNLTNSELFKKRIRSLQSVSSIQWDNILDTDIINTDPKTARASKYSNGLIFWMKNGNTQQPIAISIGKSVWIDIDSCWGVQLRSSAALAQDSDFVYIIPRDIITKYSISNSRHAARADVKSNEQVKKDNILRYKSIIAKRKSDNADIDNKVKELMSNYQKEFESLMSNGEWYTIKKYGDTINNLIKLYSEYVYIKTDLTKGSAYLYQTKEITDIINKVNNLHSNLIKK